MLKKRKKSIWVFAVLIIIGLVLISTLARRVKHIHSEKHNNNPIDTVISNPTPKSFSKLNNKTGLIPDKNESPDQNRIGADNKNLIETHVKSFAQSFYSNNLDELNMLAGIIFKLGKKAIPDLLNIISDQSEDPLLRKMTFELVRDIGLSPDDVKMMADIARNKTENTIIRGEAVWALGLTSSQEAVEPLIEFLSDENEVSRIRKLAATSLGLLEAEQAGHVLIETLNNKNNSNRVRAAFAEAIGLLNNPLNKEVLHGSINDQSWEVQISSVKALATFDDESSSLLLQKKLTKQIQNKKTDINDAIVKSIIDSLILLNSKSSVPVLKGILKGNDPFYSSLSGQALGELGDPQSIPEISEVLKTANDIFQIRLLEEALDKLSEK
jgi:HEAT repeat protein